MSYSALETFSDGGLYKFTIYIYIYITVCPCVNGLYNQIGQCWVRCES